MNSLFLRRSALSFFCSIIAVICGSLRAETNETPASLVAQIQRADYEGDRAKLKSLHDTLTASDPNEKVAARLQYWRGFAMWRRAINGFNDSVDPKELEQDLNQALDDFKAALAKQPDFVDAKIAIVSCLGNLAFINKTDQERTKELIGQSFAAVSEIKAAAPDNPRFFWVMGPILWNTPADRGGGQDKAIANYDKGLEFTLKDKMKSADPLDPSWGEAELLMSRAWSYLNRAKPDLDKAEVDARAALALVPYWHYVRDILLAQIVAQKAKISAH